MIKGVTVLLYDRQMVGVDEFDRPIYKDVPVSVDNVLVAQPSSSELISSQDLDGKRIQYLLGIPKGDMHNWENKTVSIFGTKFKTYGNEIKGIESNVPGRWHRQILVARYE